MEEISYRYRHVHYLDFDIFSKSIGFFYHDKEKIGSIIGFVFTIIYIIISMILFLFYTVTTINKRDMKVHDSLLFQKEAPEIEINPSLFYFAFGVENHLTGYTRFIDETIYYPKVEYVNKIKDGPQFKVISEDPINFERCQEEKFGTDYRHLLVNGELNNSYCINYLNLTLAGNFKYDKLSYIRISFYPCVNKSENNNHCKPKEIIDSFLSGTFVSLLAKDIGLEPSNYTHPFIPTFQDLYVTIDKSFFTEFSIFFGITEVQTDIGLLGQDIQKDKYIHFVKTTQGMYYRNYQNDSEAGPICEVQIRMGDDIRIQKRTYMKMSEVFAITGGYMQLISSLFSFITFLINSINNEIQLVNSIFNFYPKKRKISLKYQLQKITTNSPKQNYIKNLIKIPKMQYFPTEAHSNKNNSISLDNSKNNLILFNNLESSSINKPRKQIIVSKNNNSNKPKKSHSKINNNKTRLKPRSTIFEKNIENEDEKWKKNVRFNSFYYYCLSMFLKNKDEVQLFNLAISFYKQKMDIIYLFHMILLVEKIWQNNNGNFSNDEETIIRLKDK